MSPGATLRAPAAVVVLLIVLVAGCVGALSADHPAASTPKGGDARLALDLPTGLLRAGSSSCPNLAPRPQSSVFGVNIPAEGSGAYATSNLSTMTNNSGANTTLTVPNAALSSNQYVLLGVGDPVNATTVVAVGVAETAVPFLGTVAVPVAYLPNGSEVYSTSLSGPFLTKGAKYTLAVQHVRGNWWNLTYNGNPIIGGAAWENGTYDLGTPRAEGVACSSGVRATPAFVAALYGNGTSPPTLPTTFVPRAVGVAPGGAASATFVPQSGNALPQLNASLGTVYLQGNVQNSSVPPGAIYIGSSSSLGYPGPNASVWGAYVVRSLGVVSVAPLSTGVAFTSSQLFSVNVTDQNGARLDGATIAWQLEPANLGTLNATTGASITFTAGTTTLSGALWANVTYNCTFRSARANISVSPAGGPAILSFAAAPSAIVVGEGSNFSTVVGSWARPVTYSYLGLPAPCASANTSQLACVPGSVGIYPVTVFVNDSTGASSNATASLTVDATLQVVAFTASPNPASAGGSVAIAVQASGGVPPLAYSYSGLPPGCPGGPVSPSFVCPLSSADSGTYSVHADVSDSAHHSTGSDLTLTVVASSTPPTISSFVAAPNPVTVGSPTSLDVLASGGSGPLGYAFSGLPTGCVSANTSSLECTPNSTGAFNVTVRVTDPSGRSASQSLVVDVVAGSPRGASTSSIPGEAAILVVVGLAVVALLAVWAVRRRRPPTALSAGAGGSAPPNP